MNEDTARVYIKMLIDSAIAKRQAGALATQAVLDAEKYLRSIVPHANELSNMTRSKLAGYIMQHVPKPRSA